MIKGSGNGNDLRKTASSASRPLSPEEGAK